LLPYSPYHVVLLIGIEAAHAACLLEQVLRKQRAHERLAYAAFSQQDKMNRVLQMGLTSKDQECRAGRNRRSAACDLRFLRIDSHSLATRR
jgi:hypothetical protein